MSRWGMGDGRRRRCAGDRGRTGRAVREETWSGRERHLARKTEVLTDSRYERMWWRQGCSDVPSGDCGLCLDPSGGAAVGRPSGRDRHGDGSATTGRTPACTEPGDRLTKSADGSLANEHLRLDGRPPRRPLTDLLMGDTETRRETRAIPFPSIPDPRPLCVPPSGRHSALRRAGGSVPLWFS